VKIAFLNHVFLIGIPRFPAMFYIPYESLGLWPPIYNLIIMHYASV